METVTIQRNDHEEIRVTFKEYKERPYLDLRLYYRPDGQEEMYPTRKGLTVSADLVDALLKAVQKCKKQFESNSKQIATDA